MAELEHEAEELRQLWKSSTRSTRPDIIHSLLSSSMYLNPEEEEVVVDEGEGGMMKRSPVLKRWESERLLKLSQVPNSPDRIYDHECACVRRAAVVKIRGISLLSEVDAQYSALQTKYEELLQRCRLGLQEQEELSCTSVQTASPAAARGDPTHVGDFEDDIHQPEYKELFREIFSRIQKTKEDLIENRSRAAAGELLPNLQ